MARRPSWRLAVVVLIALLGVGAVATFSDDEPAPPAPAPERFLDAWVRSRAATFRSVADFTRTSNSTDASLTDRIVVAQRPPDRLAVDRDGATGLLDGRRVACTFRDEELACQDALAQRTYDDDVRRQVATLEGYVTGDDPLYVVTAEPESSDGDCFELRLSQEIPAPPLGRRARYCFDPAIGAPTLTRIERVEADDETRVLSLTGEVRDADLVPESADEGP